MKLHPLFSSPDLILLRSLNLLVLKVYTTQSAYAMLTADYSLVSSDPSRRLLWRWKGAPQRNCSYGRCWMEASWWMGKGFGITDQIMISARFVACSGSRWSMHCGIARSRNQCGARSSQVQLPIRSSTWTFANGWCGICREVCHRETRRLGSNALPSTFGAYGACVTRWYLHMHRGMLIRSTGGWIRVCRTCTWPPLITQLVRARSCSSHCWLFPSSG